MASVTTSDVTVAAIETMEGIHGGLARRARATLGVSAWGMQVLTLPPRWDGYPEHNHDANAFDPNQEEVYIPLAGSATLVAGEETFDLVPGMMARVGPEQPRRILPGPEGIRFLALGGRPGSFDAPAWTELGAPPPMSE
jgi:mannose-6-phosphate isomerase-like protein (cupin superfamily)